MKILKIELLSRYLSRKSYNNGIDFRQNSTSAKQLSENVSRKECLLRLRRIYTEAF